MKIKLISHTVFLFSLLCSSLVFCQGGNSVEVTVYKHSTTTSIANPDITQAEMTTSYLNGFGKPIQIIKNKSSLSGKNIIRHIEYDAFGRQKLETLPYLSDSSTYDASAVNSVLTFYSSPTYQSTGNPLFEPTVHPFSEQTFSPFPINNIVKQSAAGDAWIENSSGDSNITNYEYLTNSSDEVKLYIAQSTWDAAAGLYSISLIENGSSMYIEQQLIKKVLKDENWVSGKNHSSYEFIDKRGNVIVKKTHGISVVDGNEMDFSHDTYYVYDQYNNLTYIIPPIITGVVNQTILDDLCYQYKYDKRNRLVEKKLPGMQWQFIVYDKLNREIATGPAFSPFKDVSSLGWLVSKYDKFDRKIISGWMPVGNVLDSNTRKNLQIQVDAEQLNFSESKSTSDNSINGVNFRYTKVAFPTDGFHILNIIYFDNYDFPNAPTVFGTIEGQPVYYNNSTMPPKELTTGAWERAVQTSSTYSGNMNVFLYDYKSRVIHNAENNYLGGYTNTDYLVNFAGKILKTVSRHKQSPSGMDIYVKTDYGYNDQGYISSQIHQVGQSGIKEFIKGNIYDEFGTLIEKHVGGADISGTNFLQKVNYAYNVRGWLNSINDVDAIPAVGNVVPSNNPDDLFNYKINYTTVADDINGSIIPQFNGNIAEIFWKTRTDNVVRKYGFQYDALDRLKNAVYQKPQSIPSVTNSYNESISYDANGNIFNLRRTGEFDDANYSVPIDNLRYDYDSSKRNQLMRVTDDENNLKGFKDGYNQDDDYSYDLNGNMISDKNKGITSIVYNHLNLPISLLFNNDQNTKIEYTYSATGEKLQKKVFLYNPPPGVAGPIVKVIDYVDGFQYTNSILDFFPTEEGYVKFTEGSFNYVYNYCDHLGNIRLSYGLDPATNTVKILDQTHYYPFGLKHNNYNGQYNNFGKEGPVLKIAPATAVQMPYKYKYNGKEYQDELGLNTFDYGARNYDPALARWLCVDNLSEEMPQQSVYSYGFNNPVFFIDYGGLEPTPFEAALMANHVYNNSGDLANGWAMSHTKFNADNKKTGLKAALYERVMSDGKKEYAYVYAGTNSIADIGANTSQILGNSRQHNSAIDIALELDKYMGGRELTFVGHSLGGALSNLSSLVTGRSSLTFNPAWISKETFKNTAKNYGIRPGLKGSHMRNYVHEFDPLDLFQRGSPAVNRSLIEFGEHIEVDGDFSDLLDGHFIGEMIQQLIDNGEEYAPNEKKDDEKKEDDDDGRYYQSPRYW